ncbi:hypothetical protein [Bradyrhizobium sp. sBnM-33]|uniref:hypothetical protein n=1 Tax=Bradyrhizobium sp. sBnM-33 TaxID=2831780 RepID=UPI001BCFA7D0|nr:hypothetical protein [Bradyrhizobium sp. sBnM-33]WOH51621.1 hypothetical protein RX328_04885 [Bradyrhizobium sp. sBnM-33]
MAKWPNFSAEIGFKIAVVILALFMVPVFFVSVQRVLAGTERRWRRPREPRWSARRRR